MYLSVSCTLRLDITEPTVLILMLRPYRGTQQWVQRELYALNPVTTMREYVDNYGNACQQLLAPLGELVIHTEAEVIVDQQLATAPGAEFVAIQYLPNEVLPFLLPSRYCESDRLGDLAREITLEAIPGYDQVVAINQWVQQTIEYLPGSSDLPISAIEVYQRGYGVCRDLAQLAIALCRSISIPARMVVGYLYNLEPMDLHAWFEVYVGGQWYTFDPTQSQLLGGRVIIAFGRDAADVAIFHQFGSGCILQNLETQVKWLNVDSY